MRLTLRERENVAIYDERGRRGENNDPPVWVDEFTAPIFGSLSPRHEVVDVGCGWGRAIPLLPDLGITGYLGVDPAKGQIELARKLHPRFSFAVGSIYTVGKRYPRRFDGFWMAAVFLFIPRHRALEALQSLRKCLKTGAPGLISTPRGSGEACNPAGMVVTLYESEEIIELLAKSTFRVRDLICPDGHMMLIDAEAT